MRAKLTKYHRRCRGRGVTRRWGRGGALLAGAALLSLASATDKKRYCIRRSALVPVPAPSLRPAQPADEPVELGVSNDTVLYLRAPARLKGSNVGLYVPRAQLGMRLSFKTHRVFSLGASGEVGLPQRAIPVAQGLLPAPNDVTGGGGVHLNLHIPASKRVTVDIACDLWGYRVPSRIAYYQTDASCSGAPDPRTWTSTSVATAMVLGRIQIAVGIDFQWSHLTLGAGVRNQPANTDATEEWHIHASDIEPRLSQTAYPYLYAYWDIRVSTAATLGIGVYQPMRFDPVVFAPVLGLQLRLMIPKPVPRADAEPAEGSAAEGEPVPTTAPSPRRRPRPSPSGRYPL